MQHFPDDLERPPVPKWVAQGISHEETIGTERSKKYPLLVISNHPRWSVHSQHEDITWLREIDTCKVTGPDGYQYLSLIHISEPTRLGMISYAVFCLKKKKKRKHKQEGVDRTK